MRTMDMTSQLGEEEQRTGLGSHRAGAPVSGDTCDLGVDGWREGTGAGFHRQGGGWALPGLGVAGAGSQGQVEAELLEDRRSRKRSPACWLHDLDTVVSTSGQETYRNWKGERACP